MSGFSYVDEATQVPALWEVPPERTTGSPLRLIGVPADESAVLNGARLRNGYGGLEALQAIEMFSAQDLQDLEATIQTDNVQDLLPEFTAGPPSDGVLATMLGALTVQREFASLLTAFRPSRLSERVFNLMTALKRLLVQHRLVRAELGRSGDAVKENLTKLRADNVALRREWQAMTAYWEGEVMLAKRVQAEVRQEFTSSLRRQEEDHQYLQNGYVDELNQMREQLNDTRAQCEILRRDLREQSLGSWAFSDFLEAEPNVTVSGNWKRLQELLGHFAAGSKPPVEWITNIHVMAADQPRCVCGDYKAERDQARLDDESKPPSRTTTEMNLSGPGSAVKRVLSKRPSHQGASQDQCTDQASFEEFRRTLQLRPTSWAPSKVESRPAKEPLVMTEEEARKSLPGPQIWAELRPDLRYVMFAGHSFEQALKLVREDNVLHPMFHCEALRDMLASMILDSELDSTPWAQYVPEVYYLSAETKLESIYCRAETVEVWHPLDQDLRQEPEPPSSPSESDHDSPYHPEDPENDGQDGQDDTVKNNSDSVIPSKPAQSSVLKTPTRGKRAARPTSSDSATKKRRTAISITSLLDESPRVSSRLASIPFEQLTLVQLRVVEDVDPSVTSSFRCFGIKLFFHGKKSKPQTPGFPSYAPQKCDVKFLYLRWSIKTFNTIAPSDKSGNWILSRLPWVQLFAERTQVFYFHRASELSPEIMAGLKQFIAFMEKHSQGWWDLLHWITIHIELDKASKNLHSQRRTRTDSLQHKYHTELKRLRAIPGFQESLLEEPGIWPLPQRACHWIWEDPRTKPK